MTTAAIPRVADDAATPVSRSRRFALPSSAEDRLRLIQVILFALGAVLLPLGLIVIGLGWYGSAHTPYLYDQMSYLVSGGMLGLGLTFTGGFLYFGAWLAKVTADQRDTSRQLADALAQVAQLVAASNGVELTGSHAHGGGHAVVAGSSTLVRAGRGTTIHRRDCPLVANRADLHELTGAEIGLTPCRVCHPDV